MKISFITTVFNEEHTIIPFLNSLISQSKLPNDIVIVDGGSTDKTRIELSKYTFPKKVEKVTILTKKGNRSVGRNYAIKKAVGDIILCSDSGNILDSKWIENIIKPFHSGADVVAGYYKGKGKTIFQKCLIPYALVMPNKINYANFLPATRSIAFKKNIWKKIGGFNEKFSHNEDYVFAKQLEKNGANIVFNKAAYVYWIPRKNFKEAFVMFFRFAYGDAEAGIMRPKVLVLFLRYIIMTILLWYFCISHWILYIYIFVFLLLIYIIWAAMKNYQHVKKPTAYIILPMLQFTADVSVLLGTILGIFRKLKL